MPVYTIVGIQRLILVQYIDKMTTLRTLCLWMDSRQYCRLRRRPEKSYNVRSIWNLSRLLTNFGKLGRERRRNFCWLASYHQTWGFWFVFRSHHGIRVPFCSWVSLIPILQQSGSPMKIPNVLEMQRYFDDLVNATNCTDAKDRLDCLRAVPYSQLIQAVNLEPNMFSYPSMKLAWQPMIDGSLIPRDPFKIIKSGEYARVSARILQNVFFLDVVQVPFITGDCEDEGT